jgi:hypothetical protein
MIFLNWFNSKKGFFQARRISLLNEKLVAKKDSADRASYLFHGINYYTNLKT